MKIFLCLIAKTEELYIREWVEHHKKLGVNHIIIGDNNSSVYPIKLADVIKDYIDSGYVEVINLNDLQLFQGEFYNKVFNERKGEFDYIGFIDTDEFIELPKYKNIQDLFLNKDAESLFLKWFCYGDSEKLLYENKPVRDRFTIPSKKQGGNFATKYFLRNDTQVNRILHPCYPPTRSIVDVYGNPIKSDKELRITINDEINVAYISHYITKSTEEYIKYKMLRGRLGRNISPRYTVPFYFNYNEETEDKKNMFQSYTICKF